MEALQDVSLERAPLLERKLDTTNVSVKPRLLLAAGISAALVGTAVVSQQPVPSKTLPSEMSSSAAAGSSSLSVSNNDYAPWGEHTDLYGWEFVAEPYRMSHFEVTLDVPALAAMDEESVTSQGVRWTITQLDPRGSDDAVLLSTTQQDLVAAPSSSRGKDSADTVASSSKFRSRVAYTCEKAGRELLVEVVVAGYTHSTKGACKYVRRELRDLTTADRESYFTALSEVHRHTTASGQAVYGEAFRGVDEMNKQHMTFPDFTEGCTSMHNYLSFITGHTAMWRQLEVVLQLIDPKIAAPYWDLTLDYMKTGMEAEAWTNSVMFRDDWFGSLTKNSLADSKYFSDAIRPRDVTYPERSSYGFTTMVFNNDDSEFVTRADRNCGYRKSNWNIQGGAPGCDVVAQCFGEKTFFDMHLCLAGTYHQIHFPMGGIFDCSHDFEDIIASAEKESAGWYEKYEAVLDDLVHTMYYNYLDWGEKGMIAKPDTCEPGVDKFATCRASRKGYERYASSGKEELIAGIVELYGTGDSRDPSSAWTDDDADLFKQALSEVSYETVRMMGDTLFILGKGSTFMEPYSASVEPFFWAVHENLERFWLYAALHSGNKDGSIVHTHGDAGYVDASDAKYDYSPKHFQWEWHYSKETLSMCRGHNLNDTLSMPEETGTRPFNDRAFGFDGHDAPYTNAELLKVFWPTAVENTYVFDTLHFKECVAGIQDMYGTTSPATSPSPSKVDTPVPTIGNDHPS